MSQDSNTPVVLCEVFGVKDLKADCLLSVVTDKNKVQGIRSFTMAANGEGSLLAQFPDDFALVHLGTIHIDGSSYMFGVPVMLCCVKDVLRPLPVSPASAVPESELKH